MNEMIAELVRTELGRTGQMKKWPAGLTLFAEGEDPRGIFILHSGDVDLVFSGRKGVRKVLRTMRSGDVLGLSEVISRTTYDCTAMTRVTCRISFVSVEKIHEMLEENPSLWLTIAARLSVEIGSCWQSLRAL